MMSVLTPSGNQQKVAHAGDVDDVGDRSVLSKWQKGFDHEKRTIKN